MNEQNLPDFKSQESSSSKLDLEVLRENTADLLGKRLRFARNMGRFAGAMLVLLAWGPVSSLVSSQNERYFLENSTPVVFQPSDFDCDSNSNTNYDTYHTISMILPGLNVKCDQADISLTGYEKATVFRWFPGPVVISNGRSESYTTYRAWREGTWSKGVANAYIDENCNSSIFIGDGKTIWGTVITDDDPRNCDARVQSFSGNREQFQEHLGRYLKTVRVNGQPIIWKE